MRSLYILPALALLAGCALTGSPPASETPGVVAAEPAGPTELAGVLGGEVHLSGEVLLSSDVLVPAGSTLILHPGTVVRVRPSESTKIDPEYLSPATEILVRGTLQVRGTAERPVRFVPEFIPDGGEPAWAGLILDRAAPSRIVGAQIESAETGLLCIGSSPEIGQVRIAGCRYGLIAQEGSSPLIRRCRIENGEGGVFCWRGSHPRLVENRISGHEEEGLFIDAESRPRLEGNETTGNAVGLVLGRREPGFDPGQSRGNGEDLRWLFFPPEVR